MTTHQIAAFRIGDKLFEQYVDYRGDFTEIRDEDGKVILVVDSHGHAMHRTVDGPHLARFIVTPLDGWAFEVVQASFVLTTTNSYLLPFVIEAFKWLVKEGLIVV